jgi:hypothetical protein
MALSVDNGSRTSTSGAGRAPSEDPKKKDKKAEEAKTPRRVELAPRPDEVVVGRSAVDERRDAARRAVGDMPRALDRVATPRPLARGVTGTIDPRNLDARFAARSSDPRALRAALDAAVPARTPTAPRAPSAPRPGPTPLSTPARTGTTPDARLATTPGAVSPIIPGPKGPDDVGSSAATGETAPLTPERQRAIDDWNKKLVDDELTTYGHAREEGERVAAALGGDSSLGALTPAEQQYLLDSSMRRWTEPGKDIYSRNVNYQAIEGLSEAARDKPAVARVVADDYAARAISGPDASPSDRALRATFATNAVLTAQTPEGQRALLERLGPEKSAALTRSLSLSPEQLLDGGSFAFGRASSEEMRMFAGTQLLEATTQGPPTDATRAVVDTAFATMGERAYDTRWPGNPPEALGRALAHAWNPNDPAARDREAQRLGQIFSTDQGKNFVAADELPLETRLANLDQLRQHPEWDKQLLTSKDSAYDVPAVAFALASPTARQYGELRGDTPQTLRGTDLDNTIGYAMGLPPQGVPENETPEQRAAREAATANGTNSYYRGEPAEAVVKPVADAIRAVGGPDAKVTVLPIQYSSDQTGAVQLPLFRVQDQATGQDRFVDNQGRTYQSFDDWKENNQLPPGNMVYPSDGHLSPDVKITTQNTPRTVDTPLEHVKGWLDNAALVGGVVAGGAVLLGSGGTLAPVVLGGATAWQTFRSVEALNDRQQHGQSINPFSDEGARGEWLNLGAGALSLASLGATGLAGRLAQTGSRFAYPAATGAAFLRVGANVLDAGSAAHAGQQLYTHWDELSGSERANLALSAGFWGVSTFAGARGADGKPVSPFDVRSMRDATLYGHLDPTVRSAIEAEARTAGSDRALADLAGSTHFRGLSAEQQRTYLRDFSSLSPEVKRAFYDNYPTAAGASGAPNGAEAFNRLVGRADFRQLPAAQQASVLRTMGAMDGGARQAFYDEWTRAPQDRSALMSVARSGGFQALPPATQRAVLESLSGVPASTRTLLAEQLSKHSGSATDAETVGRLFSSEGFQAMSIAERERLLRYIGGTNQALSTPARQALRSELDSDAFAQGTPREQHDRLQAFLRDQPGIQEVLDTPAGSLTSNTRVTVGAPIKVPSVPFSSGAGPGTRYDVQVDGRTIPVYISDAQQASGTYQHDLDDVTAALSRMPPEARAHINEIHVDSGRSSSDAYWAQKFGDPNFRAYMTADSGRGVLTVHPTVHPTTPEFMTGSFVHEAGHFDSFNRWGHNPETDPGWQDWRTAMQSDQVAASTYGKSNTAEDFAEAYNLYFQVRGTPAEAELRQIMPERFALLDGLYGTTP